MAQTCDSQSVVPRPAATTAPWELRNLDPQILDPLKQKPWDGPAFHNLTSPQGDFGEPFRLSQSLLIDFL